MEASPLEFYKKLIAQKERNQEQPSEVTLARFAHHALVALLREDIRGDEFWSMVANYSDQPLLLEDPSGHVPRTTFTLGSISMVWGSRMPPARVYLGGIGETNRQFTFRLDAEGQPTYDILPPNACI